MTAELKKSGGILAAKFLAARGSRGLLAKEGCAQYLLYHTIQHAPGGRDLTVAIVAFAKQLFHDSIDHHVAGAGVKGNQLLWRTPRWDSRKIRDAANVLRNSVAGEASASCIAIKKIVKERDQRRAFASGCNIRGTKIGDHRHT